MISGIGQEVARLLGESGGMTVLIGSRDEARGRGFTDDLAATGTDARPVRLDAGDPASIAAVTRWIDGAFGGRLDVLVNHACVVLDRSLPGEQATTMFKDAFNANVRSSLLISKAMLPFLRRSPAGRIVNVTSGLGLLAQASDPDWEFAPYKALCYSCSKAALGMQTVLLATELARGGDSIKVNAIDCGGTEAQLARHADQAAIERSARAIVRLATLPAHGVSGGVFNEDHPYQEER